MNNEYKKKKPFVKKRKEEDSLSKKWNKMMASILGSMLIAYLNLIYSLKHECEQQIKKSIQNSLSIPRVFVGH